MICTCIQNKKLSEIQELLPSLEMAEIRLDRCPLSLDEIHLLFADTDTPLVATCRSEECPDALERLEAAIRAGARYADLEMDVAPAVGRRIRATCEEWGTTLIRSFHNHRLTPSPEVLSLLYKEARSAGGEIVKIATLVTSEADVEALVRLYDEAAPGTLLAIGMGEMGRATRLEALRRGAPFTYACLSEEEATAPGQWTTESLRKALYGSFRFVRADALPMPASKSFAQRAILAAALAEGTSHLSGYTPCEDSENAIRAARALGAQVEEADGVLSITGAALEPGQLSVDELFAGESGLLARLLIPLLAVLSPRPVRLSGENSLLRRPLSDAHDIMAAFGVRLYPENIASRRTDCYLPLTVAGPLLPGRADIPGRGGSQLISGLLCALPLAADKSVLYVNEPRSLPYLFITVDVLRHFGIRIGSEMEGGEDFLQSQDWNLCTGVNFQIKGSQHYQAADFTLEADWSAAAPFLVAGALFGDVTLTGLDSGSLQADLSILDILTQAGASLSQLDNGAIHIQRAPLNAFRADLTHCPDLFPVVAVLAAFCPGQSELIGVERLRYKETDRASAIAETLSAMGVELRLRENSLLLKGISLSQRLLEGKLLRAGHYPSYGDHRMVMALSVAALGADGPVTTDNPSCVSKSFPAFHQQFDTL